MHMCVEDLMCQIGCIFHVLFPEELYLVDIINKQTLHVYEAGKKRKQDVKKIHVVMRLFCFTVVLRIQLLSRTEGFYFELVNIVSNGVGIFLLFKISYLLHLRVDCVNEMNFPDS